MILEEKQQDLFTVNYKDEYALCHCVSADLAMGKGIAVLFRDKFGGIAELRSQKPSVGKICSLPSGSMQIYYLITKPTYWQKPTYDSLKASLESLREDMTSRGLSHLAMPKIGCGLDGLEWSKVKQIIEDVFLGTGIYILVCVK